MRIFRLILPMVMLAICILLCAGCGSKVPPTENHFSKEEIESWRAESENCKYTMNGGYFISFQGQLYAVEFEDGKINWLTTQPDDLLFVQMNELFTDPSLTTRCTHLGLATESQLFNSNLYHDGFILDGTRPDYGSVLYMDETKLRRVSIEYGDTPLCGIDDELKMYRYSGERAEEIFVCGRVIVSDEKGVFLEELNTFRKICTYAKENGIPFDAYTEYTNIPYPSGMVQVYDLRLDQIDVTIENADACILYDILEYPSRYHVTLSYQSEPFSNLNCLVLTSSKSVEDFEWTIRLQNNYSYMNAVWDEQGRVTQCYVKDFFGKDQGAEVNAVFYSMEEFNQFVNEQVMVDPQTGQSLACFSVTENGEAFDGYLDYPFNGGDYFAFELYAVWEPYHTVNLHEANGVTEVIVCNGQNVVLPRAQKPGYEFEGWYAEEDFSGQAVTEVTYEDSYEHLYAKFRVVDFYTLTFENYQDQHFEEIRYAYGDEVMLPTLSKAFYVFKGWCTDAACQTEPIKTISTEFFGSHHLYPCFEARAYTITLTVGMTRTPVKVSYGENYTLPTDGVAAGFLGYFDITGMQYTDEYGKSLMPFTDGADIQLLAKYKEN